MANGETKSRISVEHIAQQYLQPCIKNAFLTWVETGRKYARASVAKQFDNMRLPPEELETMIARDPEYGILYNETIRTAQKHCDELAREWDKINSSPLLAEKLKEFEQQQAGLMGIEARERELAASEADYKKRNAELEQRIKQFSAEKEQTYQKMLAIVNERNDAYKSVGEAFNAVSLITQTISGGITRLEEEQKNLAALHERLKPYEPSKDTKSQPKAK